MSILHPTKKRGWWWLLSIYSELKKISSGRNKLNLFTSFLLLNSDLAERWQNPFSIYRHSPEKVCLFHSNNNFIIIFLKQLFSPEAGNFLSLQFRVHILLFGKERIDNNSENLIMNLARNCFSHNSPYTLWIRSPVNANENAVQKTIKLLPWMLGQYVYVVPAWGCWKEQKLVQSCLHSSWGANYCRWSLILRHA